jgi:alpha-beta hydrolase superfamily lysophospholipase
MTDTGTEVVLRTEDGLDLPARWWYADQPRAVIVLVHGFTASKDHTDVVAVADHLRQAGYDVVSYDARGHGAATGLCTLGELERHDVAAAVEAASYRKKPIVLVGASMGAVAVMRYAAATPNGYAGVVTVSAPSSWRVPRNPRTMLGAFLTQTRPGRAISAARLGARISPAGFSREEPPVELAPRIHAPLAIIHGARDRMIVAKDAAEIYAAKAEPRRLEIVPGMGHAYDKIGTPVIENAVEWVLTTAARASG